MQAFAIRAKNLGKCYRLYSRPGDRLRELVSPTRKVYHEPFWALQDMSLEVLPGESIGLVGSNGAGKSTTLKLFAGKLRPTTGSVEVGGRLSSILELGTGFQPQLTGRQNARLNSLFMGLLPWEADRQVEQIIEFAEIGQHADQPLSTYSSGMQARLAFAALTTLEPEILILDEALATGDARFAAKCNDYLRKLCRSGCTTIVASHDVRFLATACDKIVWIEKGRVRAVGASETIIQDYLDALGHDRFQALARPTQVLLRITSADSAARPTFLLNCIEWLDEMGNVLAEHHIGQDRHWDGLIEAAGSFGFRPEAARAGWGPQEIVNGSINRACQPGAGIDGAVYVALAVPQFPRPLPARLQVAVRHTESCDAIFSIQLDGRFHEVGRAGARLPGLDWKRVAWDVRPAFATTHAAQPGAPTGATS